MGFAAAVPGKRRQRRVRVGGERRGLDDEPHLGCGAGVDDGRLVLDLAGAVRRRQEDPLDAVQRAPDRRRVVEVAHRELDVVAEPFGGGCCVAHERADRGAAHAQGLDDLRTDVAGRARDEDRHDVATSLGRMLALRRNRFAGSWRSLSAVSRASRGP